MNTPTATPWIDVKDKMPELYQKVLAATTYFKEPLIINRFDIGHGKSAWDFTRYVGLIDCTVTHWMPCPELPEPAIESAKGGTNLTSI